MGLSASGIGSNLDVNGIITSLMEVESRPLLLLDSKEAAFQAKLSAYGSLKGAVSSFQTTVKSLSSLSKFQGLVATPSDKTIFTASAGSTAVAGSYSLEVTQLAQAQKLAAVGQLDTTSAIGTGTLSFDFGTISGGTFDSGTGKYTGATFTNSGSGTATVTIDSSNSSLTGIRDAINAANIGVTASIVNDGSATPNRLSLSTDNTGQKNSMKITVSGDAALSTLLAHDPAGTQNLSQTMTAQDAAIKVDGISVAKSSNTVTDAIEGMTLNLLKTNIGSAATLTVTKDTVAVSASVSAFVTAYNEVNKVIDNLTSFDATTKIAGLLQGDSSTNLIQNRIRRTVGASIASLSGAFTSLSDIGVAFQKDGTLALDSSKLQTAIDNNFNDIAGLFADMGKASDSLIKYTSASNKSKPGSYAISVTSLATQGNTVGSAAAGLTITSGTNDTLNITLDGESATVTLAAGTYADADALVTEVLAKINGTSAFSTKGVSVTVSQSAGVLTLTSKAYGSVSKVNITGGNGQTNLLGASATQTDGLDVVGTINNSPGTGLGQFLSAPEGDKSEGIKIQITGGATGSRGTINYSHGYAFQLDKLADEFLGASGPITSRTDGLDRRIDDLDDQRDVLNKRLFDIEARYRKQYTALDVLLAGMQTTSNFLTQQLSNLNKLANSRLGRS